MQRLALFAAILLVPTSATALTTLVNSGPSSNRVDIVFLGG